MAQVGVPSALPAAGVLAAGIAIGAAITAAVVAARRPVADDSDDRSSAGQRPDDGAADA
jgi:hypothetical protein